MPKKLDVYTYEAVDANVLHSFCPSGWLAEDELLNNVSCKKQSGGGGGLGVGGRGGDGGGGGTGGDGGEGGGGKGG
jgi:hypothetical protein